MSNKIISGGIASEYDDQIIWIDRPEVGADAAQIIDETEYTPCKVTKVIVRSECADEDEYSDLCDEAIGEGATCTGEFMTIEEVYYVVLDAEGDAETFDSIDFDDVDFC